MAGGGLVAQNVKGACYDCIVNISSAFSVESLLTGKYYDYVEHEYNTLDEYVQHHIGDDSTKYNNILEYINRFQNSLYRIRQNAYMNNGYFGTGNI